MRETMIRRVLIFALCVSGIVALWIVSDRSMSSSKVSTAPGAQRPGASPSAGGSPRPATSAAFASSSADGADTGPQQVPPGTPVDPEPDQQYPGTVDSVYLISSTVDALTVGWHEPKNGTEASYYEVTLNGIGVGETGGLQLTINWFNDNISHQFVQVRAVDDAGRRSERGRPLMVSRPRSPEPDEPRTHRTLPPTSAPAPRSPDHRRPAPEPDRSDPAPDKPDRTTPPQSATARPDPKPRPTPTPVPSTPPDRTPTPTPDQTPPPPANTPDPTPPPSSTDPSPSPEPPEPTRPPESAPPSNDQPPPSDVPETPRNSPASSGPELPSTSPRR